MVTAGLSVIDLAAKRVTRNGAPVRLTPTEWGILELLVRNEGRLVTQREILTAVWGPGMCGRPTTCGCISQACAANSRWIRRTRVIC